MFRSSKFWFCVLLVSIGFTGATFAQPSPRVWEVDGVKREALVFAPSGDGQEPAPVVFGFHGHGGSMENVARSFGYQRLWPESIVVYMQGLNTPGQLTDPEGKKPGWQSSAGAHDDRDLKFFDAVLASLKKEYRVDESRIYSTGHSNGGGFTYLLWEQRGDIFAAMAPSAAAALRTDKSKLKPKPILHVAGENDALVKYAWQQRMIEVVKNINGCSSTEKAWDSKEPFKGTIFESSHGTPLVTLLHSGGHKFLEQTPPMIVKFFKAHTKK